MDQDATWYGRMPRPNRHCITWGHSSPKMAQPANFRPMSIVAKAVCIRIPPGTEVGLSLGDIVRWGPISPPPKGAQPPIFGQCPLWPNGWTKMPRYGGRRWPRRLCVTWGRSSPTKRGTAPQFLVHVYCGQTAGWMKTPLGTKVDLGPGHIVLDGNPAPP